MLRILPFILFFMMNLLDWRSLLFPRPVHPNIKDVREVKSETLYFDSLTRGTVISGNPGTGKTTSLAMFLVDYALEYPERPIFTFDASGSLTNEFIEIFYSLPFGQREAIESRFVLDFPGHEEYVISKPLFSDEYGLSDEDLIAKATNILADLNQEKIELNPSMAAAITETSPEIFRVVQSLKDENGRSWQVTEVNDLLVDTWDDGLLDIACEKVKDVVPHAVWYLKKQIMRKGVTPTGREARTASLIGALRPIGTNSMMARYGYDRPGNTAKDVINNGLINFVSGEKLANQKKAQAWVFWDEYASLRSIINKRTPHADENIPVLLIIDEVYQLFEIPGMAKELGLIAAYYRSRSLMPVYVIQSHWQLADKLKEQIWNMGNLVTFCMDNHDDAYRFSKQVFKYDSVKEKRAASSNTGHPLILNEREQYLQEANWIQTLGWRQAVMRRYINERDKEPFVAFVKRTREKPLIRLNEKLESLKERLFRRRAIKVSTALEVVNGRELVRESKKKSKGRRTTKNP